MSVLRSTYGSISFRGRLLLLLVVVGLVQAGVAFFVFKDLQSKPVDTRIQAQLDASVRGVAPVVDQHISDASERLADLAANQDLLDAMAAGDEATASAILDGTDTEAPVGDITAPAIDTESSSSTTDEPPAAYVTDAKGEVLAGEKPSSPVIDQDKVTYTTVNRGSDLLGQIHVPVVLDAAFMKSIERYVPKKAEVTALVVTDDSIVTDERSFKRPKGFNDGYNTVHFGGKDYRVTASAVLAGDVLIGAAIPESRASADKRKSLSSLVGFMLALLLLTVVVSVVITKSVGDALRKFAESARRMANFELSRRIPVTGNDEVAILASSFNEMAENLEERIDSLVEARAAMRRQVELFGDALANSTDVNAMLSSVCGLAIESTNATHARFWTLDDDGHYEHSACIGLRPADSEPCGLEKSVAVRSASVRSEKDPWWLVVPARSGDQIVGLLTLVSTGEAFSDDDERVASRLAVQAAVGIDNARMHARLREQATRDGLTGLPNHRSLQDALHSMIEEAERTNQPLGVALLDIDNFKRVNDTYGHPIGDEAIKALGQVLAHGIGDFGMVARYGGEEFVVLMPGCDAAASCRIADRLREDITYIEVPLDDGGILKYTASFGVANIDQQTGSIDNAEILHQADVGLYNAKRSGKNQVQLAGPDTTVIEMDAAEKARLEARERGESAKAA